VKLILEASHGCGSRNRRAPHQHRNVEIPVGEHLSDVVEVTSDLIAALGVLHVIGAHINHSTETMKFTWSPCSLTIA